jgi:ATP-dependent Clp protease ATP-binding subunit ClpC
MTEEDGMLFDARLFSEPTFQALTEKRCTTTVIDVFLQVLQGAAGRARLLNHPFTESMTLLTMIRSEANVAQSALKDMKVDLVSLEQRLERLLEEPHRLVFRSQEQVDEDLAHSYQEASATIWDLVERGKQEAATLRHDYVGTEHLLLAIIRTADASLSPILAHSGVTYEMSRAAILNILTP